MLKRPLTPCYIFPLGIERNRRPCRVTSLATIRFAPLTDGKLQSPKGVKMSRCEVCRLTADHVLHTTAMINNASWWRPQRHNATASLIAKAGPQPLNDTSYGSWKVGFQVFGLFQETCGIFFIGFNRYLKLIIIGQIMRDNYSQKLMILFQTQSRKACSPIEVHRTPSLLTPFESAWIPSHWLVDDVVWPHP